MRITLSPAFLGGTVTVPASKSMAHRALICAALANGESRIEGLSESQDIRATLGAMRLLGADIRPQGGAMLVRGTGGAPFASVRETVDCGESGSTLRLLMPLFSLTGAAVRFTGRGRLLQRPQEVYKELFLQNNLQFEQSESEIVICGALQPGRYQVPGGVSSQFISGLALALACLAGKSTLAVTPPFESRSYVELTLRAMRDFGHSGAAWAGENALQICGGAFAARDYTVERDWSQAAFFAVLGAVRGGVTLRGLRRDSAQGDRVIMDILARCGAVFTAEGDAIHFAQSALHGTEIDLADCPDLGPILMVLGLFCAGKTVLRNAGRLRIKESDRIEAMETEIRCMGGQIESTADTVTVRGSALHGAQLQAHNDHRVVMAMSVAALGAHATVEIAGAQAVEKSYPTFFEDLQALGAEVTYHETT